MMVTIYCLMVTGANHQSFAIDTNKGYIQMIKLKFCNWKNLVTLIVQCVCVVSNSSVHDYDLICRCSTVVEVNNQTCSNVLAHGGRPLIGRARTAEAPVIIPDPFAGHSRSPRLGGVLYPDLVGCWTFRSTSEVQPVAVRFDNNDEDTIHNLKVGAKKQKVRP